MRVLLPLLGAAALMACGDAAETMNRAATGNSMATEDTGDVVESAGGEVATFGNGVQTIASEGSVGETVERLEAALEEGGFSIMARIDHQMNASQAGLEMPPSVVIIFGKPEVGTPLMLDSPETALDLPQRMAVYEDKEGQTIVAYNSAVWLGSRHAIGEEDARLEKIAGALEGLAIAAAGQGDGAAPPENTPEPESTN